MMVRFGALSAVCVGALLAWASQAGGAPRAATAGAPSGRPARQQESTDGSWRISAAHAHIAGPIQTSLNATASDGEVVVKAGKVLHDEDTDVLTATGKVRYFSAKTNMTCDKAIVYRQEKRVVLTGNVQMILKPTQNQKLEVAEIPLFQAQSPEDVGRDRPPAPPGTTAAEKKLDDEVRVGRTARKYPITILAAKIEYWYAKGSRHAVITGDPQARQEMTAGRWRYAWTHEALYDGEKETLRMVSTEGKKDTRLKNSLGDDFVADSATVSTQEDNSDLSADGIEGEFHFKDEEIPKTPGGKNGTGTTDDRKAGDREDDATGHTSEAKETLGPSEFGLVPIDLQCGAPSGGHCPSWEPFHDQKTSRFPD